MTTKLSLVLDTSVAVAAVLPLDAHRVEADTILQTLLTTPAIVPGVWPFEVGHALLKAERRGELTRIEAENALNKLFQLPIAVVSDDSRGPIALEVWRLARQVRRSLYDASFLHLALMTGLPLATVDGPLRQAAVQAGVALLPPER